VARTLSLSADPTSLQTIASFIWIRSIARALRNSHRILVHFLKVLILPVERKDTAGSKKMI
jgi:hypothetical protein